MTIHVQQSTAFFEERCSRKVSHVLRFSEFQAREAAHPRCSNQKL